MSEKKETFEYAYSSERQEELESIRKKYLPKEEDKMELLRKMDRKVEMQATITSLIVGIVGCLIFGFGMCCVMVWADSLFGLGIITGIIGLIIMGLAYPLCVVVVKKQREKIAPQILELTEELMK